MKTISNQLYDEVMTVAGIFAESPNPSSTRYLNAVRRSKNMVQRLRKAAIDKTEARTSTTSQTKAIEAMLLQGESITPADARKLCGCERLGARIWDLRHKHGYGDRIKTKMVQNPNGNEYGCYYIDRNDNDK